MPYDFLEKFSRNEHTEQEHRLFVEWLKTAPADEVEAVLEKYRQFFEGLSDDDNINYPDIIEKIELSLDALDAANDTEHRPVILWSVLRKIAAAAAIVFLCFSVGKYYYTRSGNRLLSKNSVKQKNLIIPGGDKAVLTLADGSKIILNDRKAGILANQGNTAIQKTREGQLIYNAFATTLSQQNNEPGYNTITTPKGGQYEVVLPDGSKVWLNAASSIKFPTAFANNERDVELSGEAYFEVAKNKLKPFKVTVKKMQVEVLGTHFSIMAYHDESSTKTTLLEGSVRVINGDDSRVIKPGQQAKVNKNIEISTVNAEQVIEWKNGNFDFLHENIQSIMRKLSRWYDVDIEYRGTITEEGFMGNIPRSKDISEVLKSLELTRLVHFKIEGRRVIVMP